MRKETMTACLVFILVLYPKGSFIAVNLSIVKAAKLSNEAVHEINMMILLA